MAIDLQNSSFISHLVKRQLTQDRFDGEPALVTEQAVLLLGDIVGSTNMVEQVAKRGTLAVETLTGNLNGIFAEFVDHIYDAGGDVVSIAGDALLCYWPCDQFASLRAATELATSAALNIQRGMHGREDGFNHPVQFRIGIGAGELQRVFVGGVDNRWELVLSGDVFMQAAKAEKYATSGSVRISKEACTHLENAFSSNVNVNEGVEVDWREYDFDTAKKGLDTPKPENKLINENLLKPFLPLALVRRTLVTSDTWLHYFRPVTVLMTNLPSLSLDSPAQIEQLHTAVRSFQEIANRYEGSFRVETDDKGAMLLAVFGLPPLAHENDAVRAIHAAWDLEKSLNDLLIGSSIGVASGHVLYAPLGNDRRQEFLLRGNVMNRAARLMHVGVGQIACDDRTVKATHTTVEFQAQPKHFVKGFSDKIGVQRPIGIRQALNPTAHDIFGREGYLRALVDTLERTRASHKTESILLIGEAGMGKTTLTNSFALHASNSEVRVFRAEADSIERSTRFYAWRGIFSDMFGLTEKLNSHVRQHRVLFQMERYPDLLPLTPLLSVVVGTDFEPTEATRYLEGEARASKTQDLLLELLKVFIQDTSSLLIVEDAHWLDASSLDFLHRACQTLTSTCILVSTRPVDSMTGNNKPIQNAESIYLKALEKPQIAQLIGARIGVTDVPEKFTSLIHERSGGNPFFAEQIIHAMIDKGVIGAEHGQIQMTDAQAYIIPSNVESLVLARLDNLPDKLLRLLKMASIVGQLFSSNAVLATVQIPLEQSELRSGFAGLEQYRFLAAAGDTDEYRFTHVITREVTYASMTHAQQVSGHLAYANWLEQHQNAAKENYSLIAYHWKAAGDSDSALAALEKAGAQALFSGGFREALDAYTQCQELGQALGISPDSHRAASWESGLGKAHYFTGDNMELSRKHLERTVEILDQPIPTSKAAAMPPILGSALSQWWHRKRNSIARGQCAADDKPKYDILIDAYKNLGQIYYLMDEPAERLVYLSMRGLNAGEQAGPSAAFACLLSNMGVTSSFVGLNKASDWYSERAYRMADSEENRGAAAYVAHIDALRYAQLGNWPKAVSTVDNADHAIKEHGDLTLAIPNTVTRSTVLLCAGDITAARPAVTQTRENSIRTNNQQWLCWALLDEVEIALAENNITAANKYLEQALAIPTLSTDLGILMDKNRATALLRMREGRVQDGLTAARVVTKIIESHPPTGYHYLDFYASAIEVLILQFQTDSSNKQLHAEIKSALKRLKNLSSTFWNVKPRYWTLMGRLNAILGKPCIPMLKKAITISNRMNMPFERAQALSAQLEIGPWIEETANEALAIYESLGQLHKIEIMQISRA